MKFTVDGKAFQQQLQAVSKVVNAKNSLNILDNFLLRIEGDVLSIMGSDQENSLVARMTVTECDGDGVVAIPARKLLEVTKEVNNQPVTISVRDDMQVKLQFQNGFFESMAFNPCAFLARIIPRRAPLTAMRCRCLCQPRW